MNKLIKTLLTAATVTVMSAGAYAQEAKSLQELLEEVKQNRVSEARINEQREAEFRSERADKQALLRRAEAELKAEQDRGDRLAAQFAANETTLTEKEIELR